MAIVCWLVVSSGTAGLVAGRPFGYFLLDVIQEVDVSLSFNDHTNDKSDQTSFSSPPA